MKRSEKSKDEVALETQETIQEEIETEKAPDVEMESVEVESDEVEYDEVEYDNSDNQANGEIVSEEELKILAEASEEETENEENEEDSEEMETMFQQEVEKEVEKAVSSILKKLNKTFEKRRVHMADKSTKREMYREDKDTVYDETGQTLSETQKIKKAINGLVRAARSVPAPTILTGRIVGVQETETIIWAIVEEINEKGVVQKEVPIKIPSEQLFAYNANDYEGPNGKVYLKNEIIARIGSEIRFVVFDVREKERFAIGSRLAALERDGIGNYVKIQNDGAPKYCEGMKIPARVIGVRKDRVRVEVMGADATISNRELDWVALGVLTDEFKNGDTFYVKVSDIQVKKHTANGRTYNLVDLKASRREAITNPADKYYDQFKVGDYCQGVIKAEASEKGVFVNLQGKMDALCFVPVHGVPQKGMNCIVEIINMEDSTKRIFGKIIRMS